MGKLGSKETEVGERVGNLERAISEFWNWSGAQIEEFKKVKVAANDVCSLSNESFKSLLKNQIETIRDQVGLKKLEVKRFDRELEGAMKEDEKNSKEKEDSKNDGSKKSKVKEDGTKKLPHAETTTMGNRLAAIFDEIEDMELNATDSPSPTNSIMSKLESIKSSLSQNSELGSTYSQQQQANNLQQGTSSSQNANPNYPGFWNNFTSNYYN